MKKIGLMLLCCLFSGSFVSAQVEQGMIEFNLGGGLEAISNGGTFTTFTLDTRIGYFFRDEHEVGGIFTVLKIEDIDPIGSFSGFYAFNFTREDSPVLPYIGGRFGMGFEPGDDPLIIGAFGGIKYFISEGGAIMVQPFYSRYDYDAGGFNNFGVSFGISLFFSR